LLTLFVDCLLSIIYYFQYLTVNVQILNCEEFFWVNAIRTAIEIYLMKTETGQLPEMLPANLPKDPFSGQDFEYEATEEGFVFRCREKEIGINKVLEYEFVIAQ